MNNRKTVSAATLACSLLSTTAVFALERAPLMYAQADVPADVDDQKSQPAEDDRAKKKPEKKRNSEAGNPKEGESTGENPRPGKKKSDPSEKEPSDGAQREEAKPEKSERRDRSAEPTEKRGSDPVSKPAEADKPPAPKGAASEKGEVDGKSVPAANPDAKLEKQRNKQPETAPDDQNSDRSKSPRDIDRPETPKDTRSTPPDKKDGPKAAAPAPEASQPPVVEPAAPARERDREKAVSGEAKDLKQVGANRKERSEDGGKRIVIEEPDKRAIIKEDGRVIIRSDETERFRRLSGDTRVERRDGLNVSVTRRPGGIQILTDLDEQGRPLRRYRRGRDGRDVVLFDNRDYYERHRGGRSFLDAIIDLPPPRVSIPRQQYIVDYDRASDDELYDALSAPPVEELDQTYALEEVRRSPTLRDRMRRIDLDTIKFEFGVWEVSEDQYPALERVARAINRVIERNPDEVFLIEGHTDAVGSDEDNLSLSDRRAESVAILLTEEFKVPPENLTTQGYGEQYLKVQTDQPEQQNRRVAVRRITPLLSRARD